MKKKLTHNLFLKILSVVFAVMLWIVVAIVTDPYKTVIISDVPITIINEEEITGQGIGQIYSVVSPQKGTVSIKVYGQRSKVDNLKASDIKAVVDFSEISSVGAAFITVTEPEGVTILSKTPEMMKIDIEALEEKIFDIKLNLPGNVEDGYMVNSYSAEPGKVKVTAPESVMQKLASAQVTIDVMGATEDINETAKIALYDASGKVVNYEKDENIKLSEKAVNVQAEILMTKEVELIVNVAGTLSDDYRLTGIECSSETVLLKGRKEVLDEVNSIIVTKESKQVDLTGLTDSKEVIIDISGFIPEGTALVNEDAKLVTVALKIEPILERVFEVPFMAVSILNLSEDFEIVPEGTDLSFNIKLRGLEADLSEIDAAKLMPYINLTGVGQGQHECRVNFTIPAGIALVDKVKIKVSLRPIAEETIGEITDEPVSD